MPAGLPGDTAVNNLANPNAGRAVIFDLLSGPKGSPFDRDVQVPYLGNPAGTGFAASGNASTGALSTGIGYGSPPVIDPIAYSGANNALLGIRAAGFSDDYIPGVTKPDGTASANSTLMYIGGGRSALVGQVMTNVPYTAGFGIGMAGQGGSRDAGAGPAFTGFTVKMVTAAGAVATGAAVETGFANRSGVALINNQSVFGSSGTASAAPA
jgi:hypothetical protein